MDFSRVRYQAGVETKVSMTTGTVSTESQYQNVKFADQVGDCALDIQSVIDPTRRLQDTNDTNLENFFRRPIKIFETEWGTSTTLYDTFDPWSLYFENLRVINRITNFKLLRCKMKVKFVINGNSFHYGRAYAAYHPMHLIDGMTQNRAGVASDNVNLSQLPKLFLDPTLSQGGEMTLPFFWYANYLDIPDQDWGEMGEIILRSLTPLKHANGATDQVTISAFAWAEDVELSVLTSVEPGALGPQGAGDEIDQAQGRISGPASAVSKAARALGGVPSIAPFAMATSMAADTVSGIARTFGYSRPNLDPASESFVNRPLGALAITNAADQSVKLTVDNKQELSIDPRIVGLDSTDQLSIKSIAARESYLTQYTWPVGTAPESLLWNARVDPCQFVTQGSPMEYHLTPSCMAALPFEFWTGTMKFRFQIVASAFHRGRIKVVYDPDYLKSNEYNTNYTNIIDISETRDFTIEVGNGQGYTLLDHHHPGVDSMTQMFSTTAYTSKEEGNGVIGMYVVNELSVPNSAVNNDITVNVFVSMGDDFEVFVPDDYFTRLRPGLESQVAPQGARGEIDWSLYTPQGGEEFPDALQTEEPSSPFQINSEQLGLGLQDTALVNKVYTGEAIVSFRQMLKRYDYFRTIPTIVNTALGITRYKQALYPFYPGFVPGAVDRTSVAAPYNFCSMTLWHWIVMCYGGIRGGMRYKSHYNRGASGTEIQVCTLYSQRLNGNVPYERTTLALNTPVSVSEANSDVLTDQYVFRGTLGANVTIGILNPVNEVEIPFYSPARFYPHRQLDWTSGTQPVGGFQTQIVANDSTSTAIDIYFATAEDFSLHFWICPPPLLYSATLPAPSLIV